MPHQPRQSLAESPAVTSYGQVIEYIQCEQASIPFTRQSCCFLTRRISPRFIANVAIFHLADRLYLASYTHAPDESTPFPYPAKQSRSPHKRSSRAQAGPQSAQSSHPTVPPLYFSIDRTLLYNAFHADFGPLHIGHLYRFAVQLHEVLGHPDNEDRAVVFWSHADARSMFFESSRIWTCR